MKFRNFFVKRPIPRSISKTPLIKMSSILKGKKSGSALKKSAGWMRWINPAIMSRRLRPKRLITFILLFKNLEERYPPNKVIK